MSFVLGEIGSDDLAHAGGRTDLLACAVCVPWLAKSTSRPASCWISPGPVESETGPTRRSLAGSAGPLLAEAPGRSLGASRTVLRRRRQNNGDRVSSRAVCVASGVPGATVDQEARPLPSAFVRWRGGGLDDSWQDFRADSTSVALWGVPQIRVAVNSLAQRPVAKRGSPKAI